MVRGGAAQHVLPRVAKTVEPSNRLDKRLQRTTVDHDVHVEGGIVGDRNVTVCRINTGGRVGELRGRYRRVYRKTKS